MHVEMEHSLPGCFSIILNQIESRASKRFLHRRANLGTQRKYLGGYIPIQCAYICKMLFWKDKACPLDAGPKSRITRKSSSSYRVVDGITPPAILQKIQLSSVILKILLPLRLTQPAFYPAIPEILAAYFLL